MFKCHKGLFSLCAQGQRSFCMERGSRRKGCFAGCRKRGVEFKGGSLHGFGGFDGFGGSGERFSGTEKRPKHKVFGRDIPGTSGTQTRARRRDIPDKNFMQVAFFCCFRQRVAGMSRYLGRDVPDLEKLYAGKLWADFSYPSFTLLLLVLQNTAQWGNRGGLAIMAVSVMTATPLKLNPPFFVILSFAGLPWRRQ